MSLWMAAQMDSSRKIILDHLCAHLAAPIVKVALQHLYAISASMAFT